VTGGLGDENELHLPHIETPTFAWVADGPDEVRKICRLLVREGTDLFKLNVSGHTGPSDSRSDRAVMTDAEVAAATEIARACGVRVLPGGDYGFAWNPHGTYARDLLLFVDVLGFTPMETLVAATRLGGEIMGRPNELGQIKPGFLADLLLVDGDPLADIKRLQN